MNELENLLESVKVIVLDTADKITDITEDSDLKSYKFDSLLNSEVKALADTFIDEYLLSRLSKFGLPILTEESGVQEDSVNSEFLFIVDPLDGTYNYVRNFGSCAISVALFENETPIFGVIYDLRERMLFWGGKKFGAYSDRDNIEVSESKVLGESLICSGFPVRYNTERIFGDNLLQVLNSFGKVRMIGSAALSVSNVARGAADAYFEKNIMLWDIAAGIALLEGAGGRYSLIPQEDDYSYDVLATNQKLFKQLQRII